MKSPNIRHLHLGPILTEQLVALGGETIADISTLLSAFKLEKAIRKPLTRSMAEMMSCISGTDVDWLKFYERPGFQCQGLFFQCRELSLPDIGDLNFSVDRSSFGNAGAMMERAGLDDFASLKRWSRIFGPVVKVDCMTKEVIPNDKTKEPFARFQSQGCA